MSLLSAFNVALDAAADAKSVDSPPVPSGSLVIDHAEDLPCSVSKTGGSDCPSTILIGAAVGGRGRGGRGRTDDRGRGRGRQAPAQRFAPVPSRLDHPSLIPNTSTESVASRDEGGVYVIRNGFCAGEYNIGGVKYTQLCAIAPSFAGQIIRIRYGTARDIVVNSQSKFMLVYFNEQGDSLVRCVDIVHGMGRQRPFQPRGTSSAPHQRGHSTRGRQQEANSGKTEEAPRRRTGSVFGAVNALD